MPKGNHEIDDSQKIQIILIEGQHDIGNILTWKKYNFKIKKECINRKYNRKVFILINFNNYIKKY